MIFSTLSLAVLLTAVGVEPSTDTLQVVTVVADRGAVVSRTDTLEVAGDQTVTEILQQSPGVYVGDNGGYAGLKTVSIRGMGSAHTTIYVDGVRVGNVQSGQGDLGVLGMENFSKAVIDYAQNSLSFTTIRPSFMAGRRVGGNVGITIGSFGTYLPSARLDWKISDKLTLSANAAAVFSKGDFQYGDGSRRENNDVKQGRGGLDLFGLMQGGDYHVKLWANGDERGTPGSVAYPSTDRQKDLNVYAQSLIRKQFSSLYHLAASGKLSYDDIFYTSSYGDSRYVQGEAQLNTSHQFRLNSWLAFTFAADVYWDGLRSTVYTQQRVGTSEALSAVFSITRFRARIALQYDGIFDIGQNNRNVFSPSVDLRFTAFDGFDITAFARRAYRAPTFNELYYVGYGNPDLKSEDAWLSELGIDWKAQYGPWSLKAKLDGYYNYLQDKIISAPSEADPNLWRPYNVGKVRSAGLDIQAGFKYAWSAWLASFTANYGFQDAMDKTPDSYTYGMQIPYVSRHSLSLDALAGFKGWAMKIIWNLRADRQDSYGRMPDWNTLDLHVSKSFNFGRGGAPALKIAFKNITDNRYELVSGYPMPGFNIMATVEYKF